jgi:hypothetical protein
MALRGVLLLHIRQNGDRLVFTVGFAHGVSRCCGNLQATRTLPGGIGIALKEGLATVDREIEVTLRPPRLYQYVSYFAYLTGSFGTAVWGYGDQLLRLAAAPH